MTPSQPPPSNEPVSGKGGNTTAEFFNSLLKDKERLDGIERLGIMLWCEHSINAEKNTSENIWSARHSGPKKTAREAIDFALAGKGASQPAPPSGPTPERVAEIRQIVDSWDGLGLDPYTHQRDLLLVIDRLNRTERCPQCDGKGYHRFGDGNVPCQDCNKTGKVSATAPKPSVEEAAKQLAEAL